MSSIHDLKEAIAETLAQEKAYELPVVCNSLGLSYGDQYEAFKSKRTYVRVRLAGKSREALIELSYRLLALYSSPDLSRVLEELDKTNRISTVTRHNLIDAILELKSGIEGKLDLITFLKRVWPLDEMGSTDNRFTNAADDIRQHVLLNDDWSYSELLNERLGLLHATDTKYLQFFEQLTHPLVRKAGEQEQYVTVINEHLARDGFKLQPYGQISGYSIYKAAEITAGVHGSVKNLIFAANGPKPEIVLSDSVSNDIKIVKHSQFCLVYDLPIPPSGLLWTDLVAWWAAQEGLDTLSIDAARGLYRRLLQSLDSPPEKTVFSTYYRYYTDLRSELQARFPALIPQVYLHYDPYTMKMLAGEQRLPRQRMDFLILFSHHERVVIEVDGKQHYADDNVASPRKYGEMVAADRQLRLAGYEVYRFGGYELQDEAIGRALITDFFRQLLRKHGVGE